MKNCENFLNEEDYDEYIESGGERCPMCNSPDIEAGAITCNEGGTIAQQVVCNFCDARWEDVYTLTGISNLEFKHKGVTEDAYLLTKTLK